VPYVKKFGWKTITVVSGILAGFATQRVLTVPWKLVRGSAPPTVAADRSSSLRDALSWAVATGVGVGVARLLAIRAAAGVWEATVHEPPPEAGLAEQSAAA
jgi:hypothetical protein